MSLKQIDWNEKELAAPRQPTRNQSPETVHEKG
jgi:hypothetical protein